MRSLVGKDAELVNRIARSLKVLHFFVFSRAYYPDVINVLRLTNTARLFRISELSNNRGYYVLEPDTTACVHTCRDKCASEEPLSGRCFSECLYQCRAQVIESILISLAGYTPSAGKSGGLR